MQKYARLCKKKWKKYTKISKNMQKYAKICINMLNMQKYARYGDSVIKPRMHQRHFLMLRYLPVQVKIIAGKGNCCFFVKKTKNYCGNCLKSHV